MDIQAGATLVVGGAVTLLLDAGMNVDGLVMGDGNGYPVIGAFGLLDGGPGAGVIYGGGGHGGEGGSLIGGPAYDSSTQPVQMGSAGGPGISACVPGPCFGFGGGAAFVVRSLGGVTVNGLVSMNGSGFGVVPSPPLSGWGGGAGGTISIDAPSVTGSGLLRASGGAGVLGPSTNIGGGGGGGLIRVCAADGIPFTGGNQVIGGAGGNGVTAGLVAGLPGNYYDCNGPVRPPTTTPTPTATTTMTATPTPSCEGDLEVPLNLFQPAQGSVTLSFNICSTGNYDLSVYNTAGEQVRKLLSSGLTAPATMGLPWDGKNEEGEDCAGGIYLLRLTGPYGTKMRKIALAR